MSVLGHAIARLQRGQPLGADEAGACLEAIIAGQAASDEIGAWLLALRDQGETAEELVGCARVLRRQAVSLTAELSETARADGLGPVDTCGTGGDQASTINVSTLAALVVAGANILVLKHGNRSASSRCGSADLLEALGVEVDVPPNTVAHCIQTSALAFLFAPRFHPALKTLAPIRRSLGVRTIFNLLGPLAHPLAEAQAPLRVSRQVVGVPEARLVRIVAEAFRQLGAEHVLVVHGEDGLDEVTTTAATQMAEVRSGANGLLEYRVTPEEFGLSRVAPEALRGGDARTNARLALELLEEPGHPARRPQREIVLLNAACAIYAAGRPGQDSAECKTLIQSSLALAAASLDGGRARERLNFLRRCSQRRF